jgi:hypothetical protein
VPNIKNIRNDDKKIENQTYIPTSGTEEGVPHFFFTKEDVFEFFPNFDIKIKEVQLGHSAGDHFDIYAKKL